MDALTVAYLMLYSFSATCPRDQEEARIPDCISSPEPPRACDDGVDGTPPHLASRPHSVEYLIGFTIIILFTTIGLLQLIFVLAMSATPYRRMVRR